MTPMKMIEYVRQALQKREKSFIELAQETGVPKSTLQRIATNPDSKTQHETIELLYEFFKQ